MNSFFKIRFPGETSTLIFHGGMPLTGEFVSGLIMAPFDNSTDGILIFPTPQSSLSSIQKDNPYNPLEPTGGIRSLYPFPEQSTSREEHRRIVERISGRLKEEKKKGIKGKTVSAKVKLHPTEKEAGKIFDTLCAAYPNACVFYVNSPYSGIWIGASPELLCKVKGNLLHTVALAGTRPAGSSGEWDEKNKEEQAIVEKFIRKVLNMFTDEVDSSEVYTKVAGPVEHLCTDISAKLPDLHNSHEKILRLTNILRALSPTPALCGYPRETAQKEIHTTESFKRGYYGGYLGYIHPDGDTDIYVNLRSMRLQGGTAALFAGGGIMAESEADQEWDETERKAMTLIKYL